MSPYRSRSPSGRSNQLPWLHNRSRSPRAKDRHSHNRRTPSPHNLPFRAPHLGKDDFRSYKPIFALYLDIQKQLAIDKLSEHEIRGRWKSWVRKWNRGELLEGWYDPETLQKAIASPTGISPITSRQSKRASPEYGNEPKKNEAVDLSSDDDSVGPSLPGQDLQNTAKGRKPGPAIPNLQDLELRRELETEDALSARKARRDERILNNREEKERLEDIAPKAEAGTKERALEKKRERADANRAFASGKTDPGGVADVPESELFGYEESGLEGFKKQKKELERKKNERELRRDEILRARAEEREERVKRYREKEDATMKSLVELARARYG